MIRHYTTDDEPSWLRCRVLAFLDTAFFDDVDRAKPEIPHPGLKLVAVDGGNQVVGITDTVIEDRVGTIDTVAIHPDHRRRGLGRRLLSATRERARAVGVTTLEAWTRDDADTLAWYRAMGFTESDHYLHIQACREADPAELRRAVPQARPGLEPVTVQLRGSMADEGRLRREFSRVHTCRRFSAAI